MSVRSEAAFVDIPTLALAFGIYLSFGLLTWFHHALPWWVVAPLGGYIVALHGSLQHEATHGYPSRDPLITGAVMVGAASSTADVAALVAVAVTLLSLVAVALTSMVKPSSPSLTR